MPRSGGIVIVVFSNLVGRLVMNGGWSMIGSEKLAWKCHGESCDSTYIFL
jgi:hypothetical protein